MSLLAAHLEAPLNEPTKNPSDSTVWSDSVFPTKAPKPRKDPSTSSFRKGLLRVQHPKMLADPLSIPKSLQPLSASQKACSPFPHPKMLAVLQASKNACRPSECFWKISGQRLQEFQSKVEIICERNVALGESCSPPGLGAAACLEPRRDRPGRVLSSSCSTGRKKNTGTCSPRCLGTSPRVPFAGLRQRWLRQQNFGGMKMEKFRSDQWELGKKWCRGASLDVKSAGCKLLHCI